MRRGGWEIAIAALLALSAAVDSANAQVLRAPGEVYDCLCKDQTVAALNDRVKAERRSYEEKRHAFETLDQQVQIGRPKVDVNNPADVDAFKRLLEQRDAAADELAGPVTESYAAAVQRYNQAVSDYNAGCAGKAFDPDQLAAQKRNLSCPKP